MRKSLWTRDKTDWRKIRKRGIRLKTARRKRWANNHGAIDIRFRATSRIAVPHALNIESPLNRRNFLKFINRFRDRTLVRRDRVILNFAETEYATPAAMIILIAEVDRAKRILQHEFSVQFNNVNNTTIRHLLGQIGFYDLCGMVAPRIRSERLEENVRHWHFATGQRADEDTSDAFAAIEGLIGEELRGGMWRGVSEAVINSVQHAYTQPRDTPGPRLQHKRWWMLSEQREDHLTVVVCDLGIGIPRSLPLNWDESVLSRLLSMFTGSGPDVAALKASLELGRSGTGQKHRGKGLPQIWSAVQGVEEDKRLGIMIHSNRGKLSWSGKDREEFEEEFQHSIFGTVIMWTVPLKGVPAI